MMGWMNRQIEKAKKEQGFSLVELMVVVAIIGILFVVLAPKLSASRDKARATGAMTDIRSIEVGLTSYVDEKNPSDLGVSLDTLKSGNYVDSSIDKDPWGRAYDFVYGGPGNKYGLIYSKGTDESATPDLNDTTGAPENVNKAVFVHVYLNNGNLVRLDAQ